jgi:hypothetical protein
VSQYCVQCGALRATIVVDAAAQGPAAQRRNADDDERAPSSRVGMAQADLDATPRYCSRARRRPRQRGMTADLKDVTGKAKNRLRVDVRRGRRVCRSRQAHIMNARGTRGRFAHPVEERQEVGGQFIWFCARRLRGAGKSPTVQSARVICKFRVALLHPIILERIDSLDHRRARREGCLFGHPGREQASRGDILRENTCIGALGQLARPSNILGTYTQTTWRRSLCDQIERLACQLRPAYSARSCSTRMCSSWTRRGVRCSATPRGARSGVPGRWRARSRLTTRSTTRADSRSESRSWWVSRDARSLTAAMPSTMLSRRKSPDCASFGVRHRVVGCDTVFPPSPRARSTASTPIHYLGDVPLSRASHPACRIAEPFPHRLMEGASAPLASGPQAPGNVRAGPRPVDEDAHRSRLQRG